MTVRERLDEVRTRIARATERARREAGSVRLIAVSKRHGVDAMREAYAAGQRDFGESYAQELVQKADTLGDLPDLRLHMIGHLQRNKARLVAGRVSAVHSVDTERLAKELAARRAQVSGQRLSVLAQVNVADEVQKSGVAPEDLERLLHAVECEPSLALTGLMTIPPDSTDPAVARTVFERLARLRDEHGGPTRLPELSMGMSDDLDIAIEAGATLVRVGTAIFGPRA